MLIKITYQDKHSSRNVVGCKIASRIFDTDIDFTLVVAVTLLKTELPELVKTVESLLSEG